MHVCLCEGALWGKGRRDRPRERAALLMLRQTDIVDVELSL